MLRQMLQTKPMSTTLRWQKHAARKSTEILVGRMRWRREDCGEGRKAVRRYWRRVSDVVLGLVSEGEDSR